MSVAELEAHEVALEGATGGLWRDALRRLVKNPAAILGAFLVAVFIIAARSSGFVLRHDANASCAARTAASASAPSACATCASTVSCAGLIVGR